MFNASVETKTTYSLTVKQIEELILKAAGVERGPGVSLHFTVYDSSGGGSFMDGPYEPASFGGATLTITKKETK